MRAARAHSGSSRGLAPWMNAKLAFTAISEIPLFGNSIDVHWRSELASGRGFAVRPLLRGFSTADAWSELVFANAFAIRGTARDDQARLRRPAPATDAARVGQDAV